MVCSLTLCFLAASATDVRSASRSTATICSSVNRLFLMGSSLSKSHLHRNYWSEETGQVNVGSLLGELGQCHSGGGHRGNLLRIWLVGRTSTLSGTTMATPDRDRRR